MPNTRKWKRVVGDSVSSGHSVGETDRSREAGNNPRPPPTNMGFVFKEFLRKQPLEAFDGKSRKGEEVEVWLAKLEEYFMFVPLSEIEKAQTTLLLLTGPTRLWWEANINLHDWVITDITWRFMKEKIVEQYCSTQYFLSKMNDLLNLK